MGTWRVKISWWLPLNHCLSQERKLLLKTAFKHSQRFIFIKSSPPHTNSSNQVDQDTTIGYTATERNKGFHLLIVKEEVAQALSQEHDLVDTRRNTEVKLCKN